jgi:hypothetical protein
MRTGPLASVNKLRGIARGSLATSSSLDPPGEGKQVRASSFVLGVRIVDTSASAQDTEKSTQRPSLLSAFISAINL